VSLSIMGHRVLDSTTYQEIATWVSVLLVTTSSSLTLFYLWQKSRGRCQGEVIYVAAATVVIYATSLASDYGVTWVATEHGIVPLGRYFSWLLTCPVIIMQLMKVHGAVGYKLAKEQENFMVVLDQVMIVAGAFGAESEGIQKWVFFCISCGAGMGLFASIFLVIRNNYVNFPEDVKRPIVMLHCLYFFSWLVYPALWVLGEPGLKLIDIHIDAIAHAFGDLLAKNVFGFSAWYIRWVYLDDDFTVNTGRILQTRGKNVGLSQNEKFGLSAAELLNAENAPYNVLLLDKSILVHKTVVMMMERVGVEISIAFDFQHAKDHLREQPSYLYDAVFVVPDHYTTKEEKENLKAFSEFICSSPFKIPMLGLYFHNKGKLKNPGEYVHGIIERPLDEMAVMRDLYQWRITACVWRRVALTMETIEAATDIGPQLSSQLRENDFSKSGVSNESMNMRRRGSLFGVSMFQTQGKEYNTTAVVPNHEYKYESENSVSLDLKKETETRNQEENEGTVNTLSSSINSINSSVKSIGNSLGSVFRPLVSFNTGEEDDARGRPRLPNNWQFGSRRGRRSSSHDVYTSYGR